MHRLKHLFVFLSLATSSLTSYAQKVDVGGYLGASYYYGDVVNEIEPSTIRFGVGAFLRNRLNDRVAMRLMGSVVNISGVDSLSESTFQKRRNWNFNTMIMEGALLFEYNLLEDRNRGRRFRNKTIPYLFAGVGLFYMMPKTTFKGVDLDITNLGLSGSPISQIAFCVPFGAGIRRYIKNNLQIGFELNVRYSLSSYIDGVGGNDKIIDRNSLPFSVSRDIQDAGLGNNVGGPRGKMGGISDIYMTAGVTFAYTLGASGGGGRGGSGSAIRCPRFY